MINKLPEDIRRKLRELIKDRNGGDMANVRLVRPDGKRLVRSSVDAMFNGQRGVGIHYLTQILAQTDMGILVTSAGPELVSGDKLTRLHFLESQDDYARSIPDPHGYVLE